MDVLLDLVVDQRRHHWRHWPSASGAVPGSQGTSNEDENRHAAVDIEQEDSVPKIEQAGVTQHSQLICLLEQPALPLHAMGNFDAPAKNMQQTDSTAQHSTQSGYRQRTADSEGDIKNQSALASVEIIIASAQQHSSATQSMRHTSTAAPAQRCLQEKIESAWRTELREKIARGIEKRDDGNRLADGEGQGDARTVIGVSLDLAATHSASLWTWSM
ncbi:uncharacterized protein FOMMEDRAFT_160013 [Fomitiporia mediterranea MF3/22]|uniref:uncharacterized protein n=1 Tax=Fomitiporia mediterranea (strain MF3/22) TaxID=694068 RepID=UPI0004408206|nr:uncharacterized protein FOMMEDRAFT_160013 [Fomitiporia mediterranea MF3/22]EJC99592.1 hypothetical protein FOMMEDRAFT_160013 [Fomitiporia mediterranea MF3/22]